MPRVSDHYQAFGITLAVWLFQAPGCSRNLLEDEAQLVILKLGLELLLDRLTIVVLLELGLLGLDSES